LQSKSDCYSTSAALKEGSGQDERCTFDRCRS
jgi:hypothetical protein